MQRRRAMPPSPQPPPGISCGGWGRAGHPKHFGRLRHRHGQPGPWRGFEDAVRHPAMTPELGPCRRGPGGEPASASSVRISAPFSHCVRWTRTFGL